MKSTHQAGPCLSSTAILLGEHWGLNPTPWPPSYLTSMVL